MIGGNDGDSVLTQQLHEGAQQFYYNLKTHEFYAIPIDVNNSSIENIVIKDDRGDLKIVNFKDFLP